MASASLQGLRLSSRPCVLRASARRGEGTPFSFLQGRSPRLVTLASAMPFSFHVAPPAEESQRQGSPSHAVAAAAAAAGLAIADVTRGWSSTSADALPSGATMANLLLGYRRVLEQAAASGDCLGAAAEGTDILGCVRDWLLRHHHVHVQHGCERCPGAQRHKVECAVEACLWDLERDITRMTQHHTAGPGLKSRATNDMAVPGLENKRTNDVAAPKSENMSMQQHTELQRLLFQLARLHCTEAASLLRSL